MNLEFLNMAELTIEESILKSLPNFMNSFSNNFPTCLLCNNYFEADSDISATVKHKKILKEICIKTIIPQTILSSTENPRIDESFPFCNECTETVSNLCDLYSQFQSIQGEFNNVRGQVATAVIKTFILLNPDISSQIDEQEHENKILDYWRKTVGIETNAGEELQNFEEMEAPLDEFNLSAIKSETIDEFYEDDHEDYLGSEQELEEPEEFISPAACHEDEMLVPVIRLERVKPDNKLKASKKAPTKTDSDFDDKETDKDNCNVEESEQEDDSADSNEDDDDENLEDYEPPRDLEIPNVRRVTRRFAKNSSVELLSPELINNNEANNSASSNTNDEEEAVIRVKRKYTRRNKKKKSAKIPKEKKPKKIEGDEVAKKVPKPRRKRIRTKVTCPTCGKLISSHTLPIHMRIHTNFKPYKCPDCSMSFYKKSNLNAHAYTHKEERPHCCELCDFKSIEKAGLRYHKAYKHDIFESDFQVECDFCQKKFIQQNHLVYHLKIYHNPDKPYTTRKEPSKDISCDVCNIKFDLVKLLVAHKRTEEHKTAYDEHRKNNPEQYSKDKRIRATTTNKNTSNEHEETSAEKTTTRTFKKSCKDCSEVFDDISALKKHMKKVHPSKNYQCEVCGKSFSENGNLTKHKRTHIPRDRGTGVDGVDIVHPSFWNGVDGPPHFKV